MNEQAELLTYVDMFTFAMIELNLYLDVYPNDKNMIELYNKYRHNKQQLVDNYEEK